MAKSKWLQEVEDDANRITLKRIQEQKEEAEYQESKPQKAEDKKGK